MPIEQLHGGRCTGYHLLAFQYEDRTLTSLAETRRVQETMCGVPVRSQQGHITRVAWATWLLTFLAVAGRFAARSSYFQGAGYGWDDWVILGTEVIVTAVAVIGYLGRLSMYSFFGWD